MDCCRLRRDHFCRNYEGYSYVLVFQGTNRMTNVNCKECLKGCFCMLGDDISQFIIQIYPRLRSKNVRYQTLGL